MLRHVSLAVEYDFCGRMRFFCRAAAALQSAFDLHVTAAKGMENIKGHRKPGTQNLGWGWGRRADGRDDGVNK